jgi:hypothetical protein
MNSARHALCWFGLLAILAAPLWATELAGNVVGISPALRHPTEAGAIRSGVRPPGAGSDGNDRPPWPHGRVHVGGTDVNAERVRPGTACVWRHYARDPALQRLVNSQRPTLPFPAKYQRQHSPQGARIVVVG